MSADKQWFWDKRVFVTYLLSILVFWIHISTFINYQYDDTIMSHLIMNFSKIVTKIITPAAVPLFFIISGALFYRNYRNDDYLLKLKSRIKSLLLPYLLWNILNMLFSILTSYTFVSKYFINREKFVISLTNILRGIFLYGCNKQFWFIFCLFIFALSAPIIYSLIKNKYIAILSIIVLVILDNFGIGLPEVIFFSRTSIIYYMIGAFIGKHYFDWFCNKANRNRIIISWLFLICSLIWQGVVVYRQIDVNPIIINIHLLIFACSLWVSMDCIKDIKVKEFMKHSFMVFALHFNVSAVITKLLYLIFPSNYIFAVPNFILTTVSTLVIIETVTQILKHLMPAVYVILSGGRD